MMTDNTVEAEEWFSQHLSIIVFGASGDLAKKKTYPALFQLFLQGSLPRNTIICGYARSQLTNEDLWDKLRPFLSKGLEKKEELKLVDRFLSERCIYRSGQYDGVEALEAVGKELEEMHAAEQAGRAVQIVENRVFYLALPPEAFISTSRSIKAGRMDRNSGYSRVIVEKPFGHDTASAVELGTELGELFEEHDLYRIDHYLGKEMVQNLLIVRFGNNFLEPIWNRNYVKSVVISFKEDIGTQGRGGYFDSSGIIRDVMQNHLMQVLSIVAMEPPVRVSGGDYSKYIRDEKVKVLQCIKPWKLENTVLGQYVSNGIEPGYADDDTVPKGSNCPTYACVVMYVDNPRWEGVPFIMKAGKALDNRRAEVRIQLQNPAGAQFLFDSNELPLNEIVIRLQPKEAIYIKTNVKRPGLHTSVIQSELDLTYHSRYRNIVNPDAYTRLLLDVLRGKQATFVRDDELEAAWRIVTPLIQEIEGGNVEPFLYKFGSRGPAAADELVKSVGYVRNLEYADTWERASL